MLTLLTVCAAATLGGAVAVDVTVLVVMAAIALGLIGVANGVRTLGDLSRSLRS